MFLENKRNKPRLGAKHKQPGVEAELALGGSQNQSQSDRATEQQRTPVGSWMCDVRAELKTRRAGRYVVSCWAFRGVEAAAAEEEGGVGG